MFSIAATIKHNGLVTQITSVTTPDRTGLALELIGDNAPVGAVTTWTDTSSANNHAFQSDSAKRPVGVANQYNGHQVVVFDGVDDFLDLTNASGTLIGPGEALTILAVFESDPTAQNSLLGTTTSDPDKLLIHTPFSDGNTYFDSGSTGPSRLSGPLTWSSPSIGTFRRQGAQVNIYKNGIDSLSRADASLTIGSTSIRIGCALGEQFFLKGKVAHLLAFAGALDTTTRQAWEDYLGTLYGITVTH